jgi:hypothetical protein
LIKKNLLIGNKPPVERKREKRKKRGRKDNGGGRRKKKILLTYPYLFPVKDKSGSCYPYLSFFFFFSFFFCVQTREGDERFELVTFVLLGMVYNRLSYLRDNCYPYLKPKTFAKKKIK